MVSFAAAPAHAQAVRGTLTVPLDHANAAGPKLELAYARFAATGSRRGTIVLLTGGPGEPAVRDARGIAAALSGVRRRYELLLVDQRGSGSSSPLRCSEAPRGRFDADAPTAELRRAVARCGAELGEARRFYSTYETALDLEDLRRALGIGRIIPFGVSYGAQVAGEYVRRFPGQVAAMVLDSASPVEALDTMSKLRSSRSSACTARSASRRAAPRSSAGR